MIYMLQPVILSPNYLHVLHLIPIMYLYLAVLHFCTKLSCGQISEIDAGVLHLCFDYCGLGVEFLPILI